MVICTLTVNISVNECINKNKNAVKIDMSE